MNISNFYLMISFIMLSLSCGSPKDEENIFTDDFNIAGLNHNEFYSSYNLYDEQIDKDNESVFDEIQSQLTGIESIRVASIKEKLSSYKTKKKELCIHFNEITNAREVRKSLKDQIKQIRNQRNLSDQQKKDKIQKLHTKHASVFKSAKRAKSTCKEENKEIFLALNKEKKKLLSSCLGSEFYSAQVETSMGLNKNNFSTNKSQNSAFHKKNNKLFQHNLTPQKIKKFKSYLSSKDCLVNFE